MENVYNHTNGIIKNPTVHRINACESRSRPFTDAETRHSSTTPSSSLCLQVVLKLPSQPVFTKESECFSVPIFCRKICTFLVFLNIIICSEFFSCGNTVHSPFKVGRNRNGNTTRQNRKENTYLNIVQYKTNVPDWFLFVISLPRNFTILLVQTLLCPMQIQNTSYCHISFQYIKFLHLVKGGLHEKSLFKTYCYFISTKHLIPRIRFECQLFIGKLTIQTKMLKTCGGFTLAVRQVPTKATRSLAFLSWTGGKNMMKVSWVKVRTGRDHSPITVQNRLNLGKKV